MRRYRVLIADDDESHRNLQRILLGQAAKEMDAELEVEESMDSVETRRLIDHNKYDLIILDNEFKDELLRGHLPGIAILQLMRKNGPNMSSPTIFLTGDPYDTLKAMVEKNGAVYYSKAAADVDDMQRLFSTLLGGSLTSARSK